MSPPIPAPSRGDIARFRLQHARDHLRACRLCGHRCGVDRLAGAMGPCHSGPDGRVFHSQVEVGDEGFLAPVFAIALSGCDFRCDFCNTGRESWDASAGRPVDGTFLDSLRGRLRLGAAEGRFRSVMILGGEPTVHLPTALRLFAEIPEGVTSIWKTNGHSTPEAEALLDGLFDVWVADLKFGNDACARRIARVPEYVSRVHDTLRRVAPRTRLVVRHLLMPGHLDCCWRPTAEWLAAELPGTEVSLRGGFWPGWFSHRHQELRRAVRSTEEAEARRIGESLGLRLIP
jgi:putative pyruvate formate lyase activating enzyme